MPEPTFTVCEGGFVPGTPEIRGECPACGQVVRLRKLRKDGQRHTFKHSRRIGRRPHAAELPSNWPDLFIAAYKSEYANMTRACEKLGIDRGTVYRHMNNSPEFSEAVADAFEGFADDAEDELYRRGVLGWDEPLYQNGELVAHVRKYDTRALVEWLRANRSRKFAPRMAATLVAKTESNGTVTFMVGKAIEALEEQGIDPDVLRLAPPTDADLDKMRFAGEDVEVLPPDGPVGTSQTIRRNGHKKE